MTDNGNKVIIDATLGTTPNEEIFVLSEYVRKLDFPESYKILEIGSLLGKCTIAMASVANHLIYTVDPHEGPWTTFDDFVKVTGSGTVRDRRAEAGKTWEPFLANLEKYGVRHKVKPIKAYSDQVKWNAGPIGLLFIDGDHSYFWCKHDYEKFSPHVAMGGYVVFHDYAPGGKTADGRTNHHIGVAWAVQEILKRTPPEIEIIQHYGSLLVTKKVGEYEGNRQDNPPPQPDERQ